MLLDLVLFVLGLVLLLGGAELLVRGSVALGRSWGMSPLLIGLTIVSFATSSPELVVSARAAWEGAGDLAIGNVVGSNLANIGLVLGLSALLAPLAVDRFSVRVDGPIMAGVMLAGLAVGWDGRIGRIEGVLLLLLLVSYLYLRIKLAKQFPDEAEGWAESASDPRWRALLFAVVGLGALVGGGDLVVRAASSLADDLGVPPGFIALTLVAVGTSLPELATSMVAAARKQIDVAVGNVLGSNIFNVAAVLGASSLVRPLAADGFRPEFILGAALALILLPLLRTGHRVERWEGALLVALYVGTVTWAYLR